ncbi:FAD-binding domain-containing protein [Mycena crocata]|nr:FAD-binding domain-containing protein [Mycena crocata]
MKPTKFLSLHLILSAVAVHGLADSASTACHLLQAALPSKVFLPGSARYAADIFHFQLSSSQNSTCSVEPTTVSDVSLIMGIVGRDDIRSPFAIKSAGGHATNIGFSSTLGVQIAMTAFTDLSYDAARQTVSMGPGLTWDQAYKLLDPLNVTVVGGRVPGVGVGLVLGGGYSWVTNQYGLGIDNIVSLDVVLPNGTFVRVAEDSHPELFFAMKGGMNNFGVVTKFTLGAHPQPSIWGAVVTYGADRNAAVIQALADFSVNNTDIKAQLAAAQVVTGAAPGWEVILFYGEGTQAPDVYQPFFNIPATSTTIVTSGSFSEFLALSTVLGSDPTAKGLSDVVPIVHYTVPILNFIHEQLNATWTAAKAANRSFTSVLLGVEPFFEAFAHATPSAYNHSLARPVTPCNPWVTWSDPKDNEYAHAALRNMSANIQAFAIQEGQSLPTDLHYPNYALGDTALNLLYGDNVQRLKAIKRAIDPKNIMELTGGFKF